MVNPVVLKTGHVNADTVAEAFAEGINVKPVLVGDYINSNRDKTGRHFKPKEDDLFIFFGILRGTGDIAQRLRSTMKVAPQNSWIYIDHGYLGPGHFDGYYRCCWNGLHARPFWKPDGKRYEAAKHALLQKSHDILAGKKLGSGHIVVALPSAHVARFWDFDRHGWAQAVAARLAETTDREIVWVEKGGEVSGEAALNGASALVTVQSNLAVQAVALGIKVFIVPPVFSGHWVDWWHPVEQLYCLGLKDIELPARVDWEDRKRWLQQLAACQFTLDEMRSGMAWKWLMDNKQLRGETLEIK